MEPQSSARHVFVAINAVRAALVKTGIAKTRENQQQNYKFRGIDEVFNVVSGMLVEAQLCVLPRYTERECVERTTGTGKPLFYVTVKGEFDFVSLVDGSSHTVGPFYGEAMDSADKATNKAMSASMKYCVFQTFTVPLKGEDNDADATTHDVAKFTKAEQDTLAALATAAAEGSAALKKEWQALDKGVRNRLRTELAGLAATAEKNDKPAAANTEPAKAAA